MSFSKLKLSSSDRNLLLANLIRHTSLLKNETEITNSIRTDLFKDNSKLGNLLFNLGLQKDKNQNETEELIEIDRSFRDKLINNLTKNHDFISLYNDGLIEFVGVQKKVLIYENDELIKILMKLPESIDQMQQLDDESLESFELIDDELNKFQPMNDKSIEINEKLGKLNETASKLNEKSSKLNQIEEDKVKINQTNEIKEVQKECEFVGASICEKLDKKIISQIDKQFHNLKNEIRNEKQNNKIKNEIKINLKNYFSRINYSSYGSKVDYQICLPKLILNSLIDLDEEILSSDFYFVNLHWSIGFRVVKNSEYLSVYIHREKNIEHSKLCADDFKVSLSLIKPKALTDTTLKFYYDFKFNDFFQIPKFIELSELNRTDSSYVFKHDDSIRFDLTMETNRPLCDDY